jgi:hypothetical protein
MRYYILLPVLLFVTIVTSGNSTPPEGYEKRIRSYIDSLRIIDTHEHFFPPEIINGSNFNDFMLLFQQNGFDDLRLAGLPKSSFDKLYNEPLPALNKWQMIEPYWNNTFNTSFSRIILQGIRRLYKINGLNDFSVTPLSDMIRTNYKTDWMNRILVDSCHIDYVIQDGYQFNVKPEYIKYARRFESWLTIRSKFRIDSLAMEQLDPIYTLDDLVKSMKDEFEKQLSKGMAVIKLNIAYSRSLYVERTEPEIAKKIFRSLVNGNEEFVLSYEAAKPLQDYLIFKLMELAGEHKMPVAIHTGLQAGGPNFIRNSDPTQLAGLFIAFPGVNFILYHGSYPFGGEVSALAKNFQNVYIDFNWMYSISPSYSERYLAEWIETIPVHKLMAFGGDCMVAENVYSELLVAKRIISDVLSGKVKDGYFTEEEAKLVARMMLHDNAARVYGLD